MRLARVVGNVVSTVKDPCYTGYKLMLVEYLDPDTRQPDGARQIVFDCVDAGVGGIVLVNIDGGAANMLLNDKVCIADQTICGIIDSYTSHGEQTFAPFSD